MQSLYYHHEQGYLYMRKMKQIMIAIIVNTNALLQTEYCAITDQYYFGTILKHIFHLLCFLELIQILISLFILDFFCF